MDNTSRDVLEVLLNEAEKLSNMQFTRRIVERQGTPHWSPLIAPRRMLHWRIASAPVIWRRWKETTSEAATVS